MSSRPVGLYCDDLRRVAKLMPTEADWLITLSERLETHEGRLHRRNAIIREAARQYPSAALSVSARMLSDALLGHWRSANWAIEKDMPVLPEGAFTRHIQLHQILRANGGKPLGWQMIFNICKKCTQY